MRIAYITQRFPPYELGGADLITYQMAHRLLEFGHQPLVLCADDIADASVPAGQVHEVYEPYQEIPVWRYSFRMRAMPDPYWSIYGVNPLLEEAFIARLTQLEPDVVHVTSCGMVTAAALTAPKRLELPVLYTLTGKWELCPIGTLLRRDGSLCAGTQPGMTCLWCLFGETKTFKALRAAPQPFSQALINLASAQPTLSKISSSLNFVQAVERRNRCLRGILEDIDLIDSPSHCHIQIYTESGLLPPGRIQYNPHGFEVDKAAQGQVKTPSSCLRFAFTGQIVPHKGLDTLIQAFKSLPRDLPAELHVFGDPHKDARCKDLQDLAGDQPNIIWRGPYSHEQVGQVLSTIDVVVVPSRCIENSPLTIAEAFAARTPVIGSDTCGVEEHIHNNVDGLIFKRGDINDLAATLNQIIDNPQLVKRLSSNITPPRTMHDYLLDYITKYYELISITN